jgi:hypothetical protein
MLAALSRGDRPAALEAALNAYFGPALRPVHPGLPSPLARLFTRFEPGLLLQNRLVLPDRDSRVFYVENQSVNQWSLADPSGDPPVVRDGSVIENETLSGFSVQLVLFEASKGGLACSVGGHAGGQPPLQSFLSEVPLRPWRWPNKVRFYVAPGIVVHADALADDETWVFASATTEQQLVELARKCAIKWEGAISSRHG